MRFLFLVTFILAQLSITGAAVVQTAKPEKVYRIIYVQKPNKWYLEQQELWKAELDKNPRDPSAWQNYYNAVRYARFVETIHTEEKRAQLRKIVEDMGKYVPDSYEYLYIKHCTEGTINDVSSLLKAYQIDNKRPDVYYDLISHFDYTGNSSEMKSFLNKLYDSEDIAPVLLNYNYNTLMSTDEKAILFTNGDNDTYPAWVLQQVKEIRNDVTILNASLIMAGKPYLERKLKEKNIIIDYAKLPAYRSKNFISGLCQYINQNYPQIPVYFALTVSEQYYEEIKDDLYIVGLTYQYSGKRIDNVAFLKKNIETRFRLDYLDFDWYVEKFPGIQSFQFLSMNYAVPMLMLAEHYKISGDRTNSLQWKNFALKLAEIAGKKDKILEYATEKGL